MPVSNRRTAFYILSLLDNFEAVKNNKRNAKFRIGSDHYINCLHPVL